MLPEMPRKCPVGRFLVFYETKVVGSFLRKGGFALNGFMHCGDCPGNAVPEMPSKGGFALNGFMH